MKNTNKKKNGLAKAGIDFVYLLEQQLLIQRVSNQRKLLIDFMDTLNVTDLTLIEISDFDAVADNYIKNNL